MHSSSFDSADDAVRVREASALLRTMLDLTAEFEVEVSSALSVNRRDFEAMQHLVMSGALSPTEIARRLGVSTAAATVIVDRLAAVGHVSRAPHPTDRRGVLVVPNPDSIAQAMDRILPLIMGVDRVLDDLLAALRPHSVTAAGALYASMPAYKPSQVSFLDY